MRRFARDRSGSVLIEVAFALPLLLLLISGGFEIGRYALLEMKVGRAAVTLADLVSQNDPSISSAEIADFSESVPYIGQPFSFSNTNTEIIVTGVRADETDTPKVCWQATEMGTLGEASSVGAPGDTATLPQNLALLSADTVIVAEVFYNYEPAIFSGFIGAHTISASAVFRPRLAKLDTLTPSGATCS
jgi:hypothetical protein